MIGSADIPIAMPAQGLGRCDSRTCASAPRASSHRNARAGAWTLRQGPMRTAGQVVDIAMPAQGLGRCDFANLIAAAKKAREDIAMPAQGLGRCDSTCRRMVSQPFADRNARAGAWTLRLVDTTLTANVDTVIAMPAQGLGRCDVSTRSPTRRSAVDRNARAGAWTLRQPGSGGFVRRVWDWT